MNKNAGTVMEFAGAKHDMGKLMALAGTCPEIPVGGLKLNEDDDHPLRSAQLVTFHNKEPEPAEVVLLYKQHGNYTVLYGRELIGKTVAGKVVATARLITTHVLKRVRYEAAVPATAERVVSSSASGAMADKMQEAFRFDPSKNNVKVNNAAVSGARLNADAPFGSTAHSSLTQQCRAETKERMFQEEQAAMPAAKPNEVYPNHVKFQNSSLSGSHDTTPRKIQQSSTFGRCAPFGTPPRVMTIEEARTTGPAPGEPYRQQEHRGHHPKQHLPKAPQYSRGARNTEPK